MQVSMKLLKQRSNSNFAAAAQGDARALEESFRWSTHAHLAFDNTLPCQSYQLLAGQKKTPKPFSQATFNHRTGT